MQHRRRRRTWSRTDFCVIRAGEGEVMYRAAILGCGPRAVGHAEAYAEVESGRLVAACDADEGRLGQFCDRFGIERRFVRLQEMLEEVRPELLHIVTPPERDEIVAEA